MTSSVKTLIPKLLKEVKFTTTRSSGPGGQSVNKVSTKVSLQFSIPDSKALTNTQRERLLKKLASKLSAKGHLIISAQESRSQAQNKQRVIDKFSNLIEKGLKKPKPRKPTTRTKASVERRLKSKKEVSEKKQRRKKLD